ncbi:citrate synthase [Sulfurisphaera ohwakuensis]|uniref:Citrate synthase n=1 Tax=Sulfurisphaera ohwakuensis TaxID=69656 RepID=A0A650CI81_SULOH|nr:citrate synthase [Sulfurisphaera ohwakuensis]MBB5253806.1 citrate synthase [Sulfurisphaera ohwakuensis]QGR17520.1 citrate synthase [Sulfurisphaera ohwakuensis]
MSVEVSRGLENVIIKTTGLTYIDGINGILRYRGYDINDLVNYASYEELIHLMLYGELPNRQQLNQVKGIINESFEVPEQVISTIFSMPRSCDAIGMMETAFGILASIYDPKWNKTTNKELAVQIIAKTATITANIYRAKEGLKPKIPEPSESYAESFLAATFGKKPTQEEIKAMDASLILYTDHEVPASTTAALVASSTLSDMYSCIVAALAALKGPLHGGAAEEAFKQFVEIGSVENADKWFEEKIIKGKSRLMGFGHRVYKTYDPRAKIFKTLAKSFAEKNENVKKYYEIAERIEKLGVDTFGSKHIYPNTDFYSGIVFYALGFPRYMFTSLFALSRVLGWLAHIIEYVEEQHRLIRPRALYIGPEKREFKPIELR